MILEEWACFTRLINKNNGYSGSYFFGILGLGHADGNLIVFTL